MKPQGLKIQLMIFSERLVRMLISYDTVDTYINDAQKANRNDLVEMWTTIKNDRQRHLQMLRQELEKEAKQEKLSE